MFPMMGSLGGPGGNPKHFWDFDRFQYAVSSTQNKAINTKVMEYGVSISSFMLMKKMMMMNDDVAG